MTQDKFDTDHPWPDSTGVNALFKFTALNPNHPEYLSQLFTDARLYCSQVTDLNDPWECKPNIQLPTKGKPLARLRKYLMQNFKRRGGDRNAIPKVVTKLLADRDKLTATVTGSFDDAFNVLRVGSFTTHLDNVLLWSHYAKAHSGICIQFDAAKGPFPMAYSVKYQQEYPVLDYPFSGDKYMLVPLLTKSEAWSYEDEYRCVFGPTFVVPYQVDDTSVLLNGDEITAVYFGANASEDDIDLVCSFIDAGPFDPTFWKAEISREAFELVFNPL